MGFKKEKLRDYFLLETGVENIFINEYMASAPGDFVKVYLFSLMYAEQGLDISHEKLAALLSLEHEDVLKAWSYWEKMGTIRKIHKEGEDKFSYGVEFVSLRGQLYGEKTSRKPVASDQNTQALMADKEVKGMFDAIEKITGRMISGTEMMEVLSWINDFNASPEIIVYGYSYCIQKKKKDIKYIAAVVKNWAAEGLTDVNSVDEHLAQSEKKQSRYKRVFQALGFARNATEEERRIMDTWFDTMEFSVDKVLDACRKTSGITNPNINYVNKVLVNWYEEQQTGKVGSGKKELTTGDIMRYYETLRRQNEDAAEERKREVYERVPRIKQIEEELISLSAEMSRVIISDRIDRKSAVEEIQRKIDGLNMETAFLLTDNGFEIDYMDIKYKCTRCKDTGMLETGEKCQCFGEVTKEKMELLEAQRTT